MVNKSKILSDLSKMAVDAMGTFSSLRKELDVIVNIKVNKIINKLNLVKRDEFEVLKKIVQKLSLEKNSLKKNTNKQKKTSNINNKSRSLKKKTKK